MRTSTGEGERNPPPYEKEFYDILEMETVAERDLLDRPYAATMPGASARTPEDYVTPKRLNRRRGQIRFYTAK